MKLIWFAAGAASSAVVSIGAGILLAKDRTPGPYLIVEDRLDLLNEMNDRGEIATLGGKMLRECGVHEFEMESVVPDGGGYSAVLINPDNQDSFDCVFERSAREGFKLDLWMTRNPNAQTH
jgi:hypothetical protein